MASPSVTIRTGPSSSSTRRKARIPSTRMVVSGAGTSARDGRSPSALALEVLEVPPMGAMLSQQLEGMLVSARIKQHSTVYPPWTVQLMGLNCGG